MPAAADSFDYVIVGAGTAGCVLAGRLAEDPAARVCLIEAGGNDAHPFIRTPALVAAAIANRRFNWRFETVPQAQLKGRRIPQPRGRVVGGSGSINGMVYSRGNPRDYEDWVAAGASGWSYAEVLPYFLRSENNQDLPVSRYHAHGGPMNVMRPRRPNRLNTDFIQATRSLGFPGTEDFTAATNEGVGFRQGVIRAGRRETTARAFLRPALARGNVTLYTDSLALRVVVEAARAVGVSFERAGQSQQVRATREVILSAGTLQSPQILLLSGIGPAAQLQAQGIQTVHDLAGVGRNLQDHLACPVLMSTTNPTSYGISGRALPRGAWNVLQYLFGRTGPFASNVFESVGFLKTLPDLDRPDVQFVFQPAARPRPTFPLPIGHGYAISPVSLYPKSRGTVTLQSPDPHAAPAIDPALLSVAEDIQPLIRAIKLARRILAAPNFAHYHGTEMAPGVAVQSDEAIAEFIRASSYTVHHQVGTCRMGEHADAVVDSQLRVRGLEGLRVVDASVMPRLIGGNTNAVVVMIAEKAADLIRQRPLLAPAQEA
ncbi:MAG TPA: GMC family oxidoreductase N-terminal domain-containing protein [Steroidobacteraceae bacterium]|jgi:choline dehydrogenase|nr:GMC family oxidoreductase N-terminal domain-containing protein [Steroidobacteraceae bacterium]